MSGEDNVAVRIPVVGCGGCPVAAEMRERVGRMRGADAADELDAAEDLIAWVNLTGGGCRTAAVVDGLD